MREVHELAGDIAHRLGEIAGIVAVTLEEEQTSAATSRDADIRLSIYYHAATPPRLERLRALAMSLNDSHSADTIPELTGPGTVVATGTWLWVEGQRVEWRFREIEQVERAIAECKDGIISAYYQPGWPNGFFSHYLAGEVALCRSLADPTGVISRLRADVLPFPEVLSQELTRHFFREADLTLFAAQRAAAADDAYYAVGCLQRCIACMVQVLAAVNHTYLSGDRQVFPMLARLVRRPDHFMSVAARVTGSPGWSAEMLQESILLTRSLLSEIQLDYVSPLSLG